MDLPYHLRSEHASVVSKLPRIVNGYPSASASVSLSSMGLKKKRKKDVYRRLTRCFFGDYLPSIELILAGAFPHLKLLNIQDHISLPRSLFNVLACSTIQHLKLYRVRISKEFEIVLPKAFAHCGWPLRTLYLEIFWRSFPKIQGSTAPLCTSILHLCASTLEKLTWVTLLRVGNHDMQSLVKEEPPCFSELRELSLSEIKFLDRSTLKLLIFPKPESRWKVLEADASNGSLVAQFLESCGTIRSLKTFIWNAICLAPGQPFTFLRHNSQLSKLRPPYPQTPSLLDEGILPMLSQSFQELKSLSLTWDRTSILKSAFELIGTLRSLEQIHLSTGFQDGWRHN